MTYLSVVNIVDGHSWLDRSGRKPTNKGEIGIIAPIIRRLYFESNGTGNVRRC